MTESFDVGLKLEIVCIQGATADVWVFDSFLRLAHPRLVARLAPEVPLPFHHAILD